MNNDEKKNTSSSNRDTQKNTESVKNIQTAPVLTTHEVFTYNGEKKEGNGN